MLEFQLPKYDGNESIYKKLRFKMREVGQHCLQTRDTPTIASNGNVINNHNVYTIEGCTLVLRGSYNAPQMDYIGMRATISTHPENKEKESQLKGELEKIVDCLAKKS